ncbi:unnamed protein product, partial [Strongylus vulgaris]
MSYPLYFPKGEQSFVRDSLPKRKGKRTASTVCDDGCNAESSNQPTIFFSDDDGEDGNINTSTAKFLSRGDFYHFVLYRRGDVNTHRFLGS